MYKLKKILPKPIKNNKPDQKTACKTSFFYFLVKPGEINKII